MSMIISFLPNDDSKYNYMFPLIECGVENIPFFYILKPVQRVDGESG
jgi:hypothetical protein